MPSDMSDADLPRLDLLYGPHLKFFPEEVGQLRFFFLLSKFSFILISEFLMFLNFTDGVGFGLDNVVM